MKPAVLLCAAVVSLLAACSPEAKRVAGRSTDTTAVVVTNIPPPAPGTFLIPPLTGEAAAQQSNTLVRLRQFPKQVRWAARTFTNANGPSLRYLLYRPAVTNASLPLVLSLHGGGPRRQFEHLLEPYAPGFAYGLGRLVAPETQATHPSFVLAPWSDTEGWSDERLTSVLQLLGTLEKELPIDRERIYVTGQSMGGYGTWRIITRAPEKFAAAIPICGGGNSGEAARAKAVPIWALHGSGDKVVPVQQTRVMIDALRRAGGTPIYWEYLNATHADTAERAYCEPQLLEWLFAQRRTASPAR